MKPADLVTGEVYAGTVSRNYDPAQAVPMALVDAKTWVMEYWLPTRRLRRPRPGESKNGELDEPAFPSAFKGLWVLEGTQQLYVTGMLGRYAKMARKELGKGPGPVPSFGEDVTSRMVLHYQLHMPWGEHLTRLAAAA